jgi:hypothetical protein
MVVEIQEYILPVDEGQCPLRLKVDWLCEVNIRDAKKSLMINRG